MTFRYKGLEEVSVWSNMEGAEQNPSSPRIWLNTPEKAKEMHTHTKKKKTNKDRDD